MVEFSFSRLFRLYLCLVVGYIFETVSVMATAVVVTAVIVVVRMIDDSGKIVDDRRRSTATVACSRRLDSSLEVHYK